MFLRFQLSILILSCLFSFSCVQSEPQFVSQMKAPEYEMVLDKSLVSNLDVLAPWMVYGGSRSLWVKEKYLKKNPSEKIYRYSFEEELDARAELIRYWKGKKEEVLLSDEYLDQLLRIYNANFLSEYVWYYFRNDDWKEPSKKLKMNEFMKWKQNNLKAHTPLTLVSIKII